MWKLKFENVYFWILDVRKDPDPEAPLVVVLRGDTTTRGAGKVALYPCLALCLACRVFPSLAVRARVGAFESPWRAFRLILVDFSCYLWTVDRDGQQRSTRPPGGSLLKRKNSAFTSVLPLQEIYIFEFPPGGSLLTEKNTAFTSVLLLQENHNFSTVNGQR